MKKDLLLAALTVSLSLNIFGQEPAPSAQPPVIPVAPSGATLGTIPNGVA